MLALSLQNPNSISLFTVQNHQLQPALKISLLAEFYPWRSLWVASVDRLLCWNESADKQVASIQIDSQTAKVQYLQLPLPENILVNSCATVPKTFEKPTKIAFYDTLAGSILYMKIEKEE